MTNVIQGSGVNNRFSVSLDTRLLPLTDHIVTVSNVKGDAAGINSEPGTITGTEVFNIIAGTAGTRQTGSNATVAGNQGQYIKVDPITDKTTGDLLIVSGSTNLPAGTTLMVEAGSTTNTLVLKGTGGVNRYSAAVDTTIMKPGMKTITVNNMIGDLAKGDYRLGTIKGTGSFTLKGTFLATDTLVQATSTIQ